MKAIKEALEDCVSLMETFKLADGQVYKNTKAALALLTETKPVAIVTGSSVQWLPGADKIPDRSSLYASPISRDEIIEECAKVCEQRMHRQFFKLLKHRLAVDSCVAAIRALKGNK